MRFGVGAPILCGMEAAHTFDLRANRGNSDLSTGAGGARSMSGGSVLVVDDDRTICDLVARMLKGDGYDVAVAQDAGEAELRLRYEPAELVVTDVTMPGDSGLDLAALIARDHPDCAVLMMSGTDDPELGRVAADAGAYGFMIKPFSRSELLIAVSNAFRRRQLELNHRAREEELEAVVARRTAELRRSREETIRRLAAAAEARDPQTGAHIERMSLSCQAIARRLGFDEERAELLRLASKLHDIGKIAVPDEILLKPGPLSRRERIAMERHTEAGHRILSGTDEDLLELAAAIAHTHHERIDGSGYPRGLKGDEIPLEGRIAAVADVYDALTSDRVYRSARSTEEAIEFVKAGSGTAFDPRVVDAFIAFLDEEDE
jgi:putative two-component system response regulator